MGVAPSGGGSCCDCWPLPQRGRPRGPVVRLSAGAIRGELQSGGVAHFSGVPFAAPPVGGRRWRRPEPPAAWQGLLDCSTQRPPGERRAWPMQDLGERWDKMSEDCLHLDVWAPAGGLQGKCTEGSPVLVWVYGGGLLAGSKDYENSEGHVYAERGVIYIRANYRVGVLGFLCPEGGDTNCGLWDLVEVLRWVQREISTFGGDPTRVTIMGQSAGADVCYFLLSSPVANKLFKRAIIQSPASFTTTQEQARELANEFATVAGAHSAKLSDFQALTARQVVEAQSQGHFHIHPSTGPGWRVLMSFGGQLRDLPDPDPSPAGLFRFPDGQGPKGYFFPVPVVDGELLQEPPLQALFHGVAAGLDVVIGGNREEDAAIPAAGEGPLPENYGVRLPEGEGREEVLRRMAWELAGMPALLHARPHELRARAAELAAAYEAESAADVYGLGPCGRAASEEQWLLDTMASDFSFLAAVLLIAERLARPGCAGRVFRYQFNGYDDRGDAFHAAELPLLMGEDSALRLGSQAVRREWLDCWAAFARDGDPNTPALDGAWRPYSDPDKPVLFWDGVRGWQADGGKILARRTGLLATARLWEELWGLDRAV